MNAGKSYRSWTPDQPYLLPPDPRAWLPQGHLAHFVLEVIEALDISAIEEAIQAADPRGERPYAPRMMLSLLVYGYCTGVFSSRRIERRTYEDIAFRYLAAGNHPEFSTICTFRRTHLAAIEALFVQIVRISRKAGLARLGHVSFDGTKVHANASKHKAMSYERMVAEEERLQAEIRELLQRGEAQDGADDDRLGAGVPEQDLPAELALRSDRLARIREARSALEAEALAARVALLEAQAERARQAAESEADEAERGRAVARVVAREAAIATLQAGATAESGGEHHGDESARPAPTLGALPTHSPKVTCDGRPKSTAQRNFTDPESRIMERGGEILQGYNCHAAVDADSQIIVAQGTSNQAPDTHYLVPMLERVDATAGSLPEKATADAGFWAPANATWCEQHQVDMYISTRRHRHRVPEPGGAEAPREPDSTPQQRMRAKVSSPEGMKIYRRRKCIPEPVFGQIKQASPVAFGRFSMRGMRKAQGEWALVCTCHNIRKLWVARTAERLPPLA